MIVHSGVSLSVRLGAVQDGHELRAGGDLETEMVETRCSEELVAGRQQVEELTHLARVEDEWIARLGAVVPLGPTEDLTEEVDEVGPPGIIEHRGVHADGHMIEDRPQF